jgi:putative transcriptional regulator
LEVEVKKEHFEQLLESMDQARRYARGEHVPGLRVHHVKVDRNAVAAIRLKTNLTQGDFAKLLGTSIGTVTKWERGERQPSGAAATLLRVIEYDPTVIHRAFGLDRSESKRKPRSKLAAAE